MFLTWNLKKLYKYTVTLDLCRNWFQKKATQRGNKKFDDVNRNNVNRGDVNRRITVL